MPQIWSVFVPDVKEYCRVKCKQSRLREPMKVEPTAPISFWNRLFRHGTKHNVHDRVQTDQLVSASTGLQPTPLLQLPIEVLCEITSKLDHVDLLAVAITCQTLLKVGLTRICNDLRAGAWAGKSLATMSSYTTSLPPPFFEGGLAYKAAGRHDLIDQDPDNGISFRPQDFQKWPARQWTESMEEVSKDVSNECLGVRAWIEALCKVINSGLANEQVSGTSRGTPVTLPLSKTDIARIEASTFVSELPAVQILQNLLHAYLEDEPQATSECSIDWYLRNLTTHELIQICICGAEPHVWSGETQNLGSRSRCKPRLSLDDLLVAQTHWTRFGQPHQNVLISYVQDGSAMSRSWAGHSFDIVSKVKHEEEYPCIPMEEPTCRPEHGKRVKLEHQPDITGADMPWRFIKDLGRIQSSDST